MEITRCDGLTCIGHLRLAAIDVGFDPRQRDPPYTVDLSECTDENLRVGGAGYDGADGGSFLVRGTRDEVAKTLAAAGYRVVAARTPNHRVVTATKDGIAAHERPQEFRD